MISPQRYANTLGAAHALSWDFSLQKEAAASHVGNECPMTRRECMMLLATTTTTTTMMTMTMTTTANEFPHISIFLDKSEETDRRERAAYHVLAFSSFGRFCRSTYVVFIRLTKKGKPLFVRRVELLAASFSHFAHCMCAITIRACEIKREYVDRR